MHERLLTILLAPLLVPPLAHAHWARSATLYKNRQCTCCEQFVQYLRQRGYRVEVVPTHGLDAVKARNGVPHALQGCRTLLINGYVVERHVPHATLANLLRERPALKGVALPGMPLDSPGMTGATRETWRIHAIAPDGRGDARVYAVE